MFFPIIIMSHSCVTQVMVWCYHLCVLFPKVLHTYNHDNVTLCYNKIMLQDDVTFSNVTLQRNVKSEMLYIA